MIGATEGAGELIEERGLTRAMRADDRGAMMQRGEVIKQAGEADALGSESQGVDALGSKWIIAGFHVGRCEAGRVLSCKRWLRRFAEFYFCRVGCDDEIDVFGDVSWRGEELERPYERDELAGETVGRHG